MEDIDVFRIYSHVPNCHFLVRERKEQNKPKQETTA